MNMYWGFFFGYILGNKMNNDESFVEMGFCSRPHGIKGQFQFHLHNVEDSSLRKGLKVKLIPGNGSSIKKGGEIFTVKNIQFGNKVICSLNEVDNRNLVEEMIPFTVFISREDFSEADEDEVFLSDLVGMKVLDLESNDIGVVDTFYDNGAQPVLVIAMNVGGLVELPFVESFFPEVDIDKKKIVMNNPGIF